MCPLWQFDFGFNLQVFVCYNYLAAWFILRLNMTVRSTTSEWPGLGAKETGYGSGRHSVWRLDSPLRGSATCVSKRSGIKNAIS